MEQVQCNKCGKILKMQNQIMVEDFISIHKEWGYFSKRDGKTWDFVLCESCAEELEKSFSIPAHVYNTVELI